MHWGWCEKPIGSVIASQSELNFMNCAGKCGRIKLVQFIKVWNTISHCHKASWQWQKYSGELWCEPANCTKTEASCGTRVFERVHGLYWTVRARKIKICFRVLVCLAESFQTELFTYRKITLNYYKTLNYSTKKSIFSQVLWWDRGHNEYCQLAVLVRGTTAEFDTWEELLPLEAMHGTTTGQGPDYEKYLQPCISLFTL